MTTPDCGELARDKGICALPPHAVTRWPLSPALNGRLPIASGSNVRKRGGSRVSKLADTSLQVASTRPAYNARSNVKVSQTINCVLYANMASNVRLEIRRFTSKTLYRLPKETVMAHSNGSKM